MLPIFSALDTQTIKDLYGMPVKNVKDILEERGNSFYYYDFDEESYYSKSTFMNINASYASMLW